MDRTATDALTPLRMGRKADVGLVLLWAPAGSAAPRLVTLPARCALVFGREPGEGGVLLPHSAVSRAHARVDRDGDHIRVVDLGSKNGVYVNGSRITEQPLVADDTIRIGDVVYALFVDQATAVAASLDRPTALAYGFVGGVRLGATVDAIRSAAASGLNVLVTGESGTGKELVAHAVHAAAGRRGKLNAVNCAAIPTTLFESELFGYKRGAFSGADRDHAGILRSAHGGTVFLDEVGDMPLEAQAKLLRVLETREVVPVGSVHGEPIDVRIVSATNRDVRTLVAEGRFRGDLHARLEGYAIHLPPLRARKEDIAPLLHHFLALHGVAAARVTDELVLALLAYDWPYNVRELASAIQRAITAAGTGPITAAHLPEVVRAPRVAVAKAIRPESEVPPHRPSPGKRPSPAELIAALIQHGGNIAAMARTLGKDRSQVHRWLREADIDPESYRA